MATAPPKQRKPRRPTLGVPPSVPGSNLKWRDADPTAVPVGPSIFRYEDMRGAARIVTHNVPPEPFGSLQHLTPDERHIAGVGAPLEKTSTKIRTHCEGMQNSRSRPGDHRYHGTH